MPAYVRLDLHSDSALSAEGMYIAIVVVRVDCMPVPYVTDRNLSINGINHLRNAAMNAAYGLDFGASHSL